VGTLLSGGAPAGPAAQPRLLGVLVHYRLLALPAPLFFALLLVLSDEAAWRRWLLLGLIGLIGALSVIEFYQLKRRGSPLWTARLNLWVGALVYTALVLVTGGLESPALLAALPLAFFSAVLLEGRGQRQAMVGFLLLFVWGLLLGRLSGQNPALPSLLAPSAGHSAAYDGFQVGITTLLLLMSSLIGARLRGTYEELLRQAEQAREEARRGYAEQLRLLTTLSAELAHELKNPLSSVKGLAALIAPSLSGKNEERMGVLRQEIERLQGILEEFLTFSRPLGPLERAPVSLEALSREVAYLHEGLAKERGVSLAVRGGPPLATRGDARKLKQILINLVQNAIEASAPGGEVSLELAREGGQPVVRVLDRGRGLTLEPERAFEAGVTTRADGSGLGLTVARALARQHGGELGLAPREGGGAVASLSLPEEPGPAVAPGEVPGPAVAPG
jgi:two-component system, NtrC family, sensor histidine kinase HydH